MSLSLQRTLSPKLIVCFRLLFLIHFLPVECLSLKNNNPFVQEVTKWLDAKNIPFQTTDWQSMGTRTRIVIPNHSQLLTILPENPDRRFLLYLLPIPSSSDQVMPATFAKQLTNQCSQQEMTIIHLHQDVWQVKGDIVRCRLLVRCGRGQRIFARKTKSRRISSNQAIPFLQQNHLWSATKAKYYYGLFVNKNDEHEPLVAVASLSARRKVARNGISHRSHELLRFCSLRNVTVVGGISKLLKAFTIDHEPDDIVTVVDRDWGSGDGWHSLGFTTVHVMPPLIMVVDVEGVRRHLVGAGIQHEDDEGTTTNHDRLGLPHRVLEQLSGISESEPAYECLLQHGFFPVYDAGVERLFLPIIDSAAARQRNDSLYTPMSLWEKSVPSYTTSYYSCNSGIVALLKHAETMDCPPEDSVEEHASMESWQCTTTVSSHLIWEAPSMLDPTATLEIRQRQHGWHTMGIVGGMTKSIYHGVYQVDGDGRIDPEAVGPSEYLRTMASLAVSATMGREDTNYPSRFLHFGLGAGSLVRLLAHSIPESKHVAVELDTTVVTAANDLGLVQPPNQRIVAGDALAYCRLDDSEEPFDCICIDVFDGNNRLPSDFYSISFLERLRDTLLENDGHVIHNFHTGNAKLSRQLEDAVTAYRSVFPNCHVVSSLDSKPNGGNTVILASLNQDESTTVLLETFALRSLRAM
jgi:hypothetical protein